MLFRRQLRSTGLALMLAALGAAAAGGCASNAGLVNMWRDPSFSGPPMRSMLVVAIRRDAVVRRILEDGFVKELSKHGVEAAPSYRLYPNAPPDTLEIADAVSARGYDGVLLVTRLRTERTTSYVPGYVTTQPVSRVSRWSGRYRTYWVDVMHPGHEETDVTVRHQVELWSMDRGGELVWSAVGESMNPQSTSDVRHDVTHTAVPEMAKQGLIPEKR